MYDHFIAVDWAQKNMAIARMTASTEDIKIMEGPASVDDLRAYLKNLRGTKVLTIEESTSSQWLYVELRGSVNELIVCDPHRNHLLSEGPKSDKIDAKKLVQLLRAGLLKPVFHSTDELIYLRKVVSGHQDLVTAGVRLKNQRSALFRGFGMKKTEKALSDPAAKFVLEGLERSIEAYEKEKLRYEEEFSRIAKEQHSARLLMGMPGIGVIGAVKIITQVVDPRRFPSDGHFLSYCGLVKLDRVSGGRSYGRKTPRYSRTLKTVFKTAAFTLLQEGRENILRNYYNREIQKGRSDFNARHAVARRVATLAFGVLKSKKKFDPSRWDGPDNLKS